MSLLFENINILQKDIYWWLCWILKLNVIICQNGSACFLSNDFIHAFIQIIFLPLFIWFTWLYIKALFYQDLILCLDLACQLKWNEHTMHVFLFISWYSSYPSVSSPPYIVLYPTFEWSFQDWFLVIERDSIAIHFIYVS